MMLAIVVAMMLSAAVSDLGRAPVATVSAPGQPDAVDQLLQQAVVNMHSGRNAEALASLDPMALEVTNRISSEKGLVFCARSDAEAKDYQARATPTSPTVQFAPSRFCSILFLRAYVLENLHRLPEAIDQLRRLIALEPAFAHYQVEYGGALRQVGDMDGALTAYRSAVEVASSNKEYAPDQAAALRGIGFVLTERRDLDGAERAYRQSLELAPGNPLAINELTYIAGLRATGETVPAKTVQTSINPASGTAPDKGHSP